MSDNRTTQKNLTLEDKLKEIANLSSRKNMIKTILDSSKYNNLELKPNEYTSLNLVYERRLKELVQEYFKTELETVYEKLNELLK